MSKYLLLMLQAITCAAWAAVPGIPESPSPGPMPRGWLGLANDSLGLNTGLDDFRTNEVFLAVRVKERLVLSLDHSMLTSLEQGSRTDELTVTAGYLHFGYEDHDDADVSQPWLVIGAGLRFSGDVFGSDLQNSIHRSIGSETVELDYEDNDVHGLAYGLYVIPWWPLPWAGLQTTLSLLVTTGGEIQAEPTVWAVAKYEQFDFWIGPRWRARGGDRPGSTADAVAGYERGVWLDYGFRWESWSLSGAYDPAEDHSLGQLTLALAVP